MGVASLRDTKVGRSSASTRLINSGTFKKIKSARKVSVRTTTSPNIAIFWCDEVFRMT